jgi:hypothetical protein
VSFKTSLWLRDKIYKGFKLVDQWSQKWKNLYLNILGRQVDRTSLGEYVKQSGEKLKNED